MLCYSLSDSIVTSCFFNFTLFVDKLVPNLWNIFIQSYREMMILDLQYLQIVVERAVQFSSSSNHLNVVVLLRCVNAGSTAIPNSSYHLLYLISQNHKGVT